jgi:hypothetical protein
VDGRIILKHIEETCYEGIHCIHLAQDKDQWQAVVNTAMNRFPKEEGNFLPA